MAIFKRFEVWLLLVLSAAGIAFVLWSERKGGDGANAETVAPAETDGETAKPPAFQVRAVRVVPEGDGVVVEIELRGRNDDALPRELAAPAVKLLTADGAEVPPFFMPFDPPPALPPGGESIVTLRYWLKGAERPALSLQIAGEPEPLNVTLPASS
ncbi:MAG: hypothetical protein KDM91_21955 [Verrucomicrobiae bacterium]|nr:hypothetical protein [Verrucomicrobiae bacterium]MCP5538906.1 hypothetical protein [Akkermansiaceae bacterium]